MIIMTNAKVLPEELKKIIFNNKNQEWYDGIEEQSSIWKRQWKMEKWHARQWKWMKENVESHRNMLLSDLIFECLYKEPTWVHCESHADSDFRGQRVVVKRENGNQTNGDKNETLKWKNRIVHWPLTISKREQTYTITGQMTATDKMDFLIFDLGFFFECPTAFDIEYSQKYTN